MIPCPRQAVVLRRWLAAVLGALAALGMTLPALAQDGARRNRAAEAEDGGVQMFVRFGWGGRIVAETWTPVIITLQGAPGIEPMQGVVIIEYAQDATQNASIAVPVVAMPDRTTEFVAAVCLPLFCESVTCRLVDDATGRVVRRAEFTHNPSSVQFDLPYIQGADDPLVASVGVAGGSASTVALLEDDAIQHLRSATPSRAVPASQLPLSWAAYSSLTLLAVDAATVRDADPRAVAAVREWVAAGGHLVIIANSPGPEWRAWLPPSTLGDIVTLDDPATVPLPGDLAETLDLASSPRPPLARFSQEGYWGRLAAGVYGPPRPRRGSPVDPDNAEPAATTNDTTTRTNSAPTLTLASTVTARTIRITPIGDAFGWRVRWHADASPPHAATVPITGNDSGPGAAGLLAEGPVGFGRVTIVGLDPRSAATPATNAARALWADIARQALMAHQRRIEANATSYYSRFGLMSGRAGEARRNIMNALAGFRGGGGTFIVIAAAMVALALLLGPGDAFILGRLRLRHRSWLTALCWITLATVAAYAAPVISRSDTIAFGRVSVIDVLQPDPRGQSPGASLAWQTSVTTIFADRSMTASILPYPPAADGSRSASPAAWWRGVSASDFVGNFKPLATFPTVQAAPELASERAQRDPWGGRGMPSPAPVPSPDAAKPASSRPVPIPGGSTPLPSRFQTWTFRSFQDEARVTPPCTVRVRRSGTGVRVQITDLPAGAAVTKAACRTRDGWHTLAVASADAGMFDLTADGPPGPVPAAWAPWQPPYSNPHINRNTDRSNVLDNPSMALALTPHLCREDALEQILRDGRGQTEEGQGWALVHLLLTDMPADTVLAGRPPAPRTVVCRIAVPIDSADAGGDAETAP